MSNGVDKELADALSYPILTEEVSLPAAPRQGVPGPGGTAPLGQVVDSALREVLGWRPNVKDPTSFVAALNQSFSVREVEGHTEWTWTPRSFTVYTEMGAVTGAQASIYARAQAALEKALPLLDGLKALRSDSDEEDSDASRAIVRSELTELVREMGEVGGPRVQRVDAFFELLLGPDVSSTPETVGGQLGVVRERLGLDRDQVNTIEEEHNLTNFIILFDYIQSLRQSWIIQRELFDRTGPDVFLGTQLVLLSRALAVMAESVQETNYVFDSVFLGPAERQTIRLAFPGAPLTVAELLEWIERVASEEGPGLIREAGKDGVIALTSTLEQLRDLVDFAVATSEQPAPNPNDAFHSTRVRRSLRSLEASVIEAHARADQIKRGPRPSVELVEPDRAPLGTEVRLSVSGTDFEPGARVRLARSGPSELRIEGEDETFVSPFRVEATFDLATAPAEEGLWSVVVINPNGAFDERAVFTVEPKAALPSSIARGMTPTFGRRGETLNVAVFGEGFLPGAELSFDPPGAISVGQAVVSPDGTVVQAPITIGGIDEPLGPRKVFAGNPDEERLEVPGTFRVEPFPRPFVQEVDPDSGGVGETIDLEIRGQGFLNGAALDFEPAEDIGFEASFVVSQDGTLLTTMITIGSGARSGPRHVKVTNPDGQGDRAPFEVTRTGGIPE